MPRKWQTKEREMHMKKTIAFVLAFVMGCSVCATQALGELVYEDGYPQGSLPGDSISGSPLLAARGNHAIGVRTMEVLNPEQVNLAAITEENPRPLYERPLTLEVWYPAIAKEGVKQLCTYTDQIGRIDEGDLRPFEFYGRAMRDSEPDFAGGPYPVIVVSHGFPGNRMLLSYIGENMATKGYVVISIEHTDNTYLDFNPAIALTSAIINRTLDQRFVVDCVERFNAEGWMAGLLHPESIGLVGYSFGGYGALRTLGAKLNADTLERYAAYADLLTRDESYTGCEKVKAATLFAPYGAAMFDADSFVNIDTPTLWLQGNADTIVPYPGVRDMFEKSVNSDRYMLTFELLNHSVAPNPIPVEAQAADWVDARRWADAVWDVSRVNGINLHFLTAFMDAHLKGETDKMDYLNVKEPVGKNAVYSYANGAFTQKHTYWRGFESITAVGLILDHLPKN